MVEIRKAVYDLTVAHLQINHGGLSQKDDCMLFDYTFYF